MRCLLAAALVLTGCASAPVEQPRLPPDHGSFDYQLGGSYDLTGLAVVARDATDEPLGDAYNICYVNGFQSQPAEGDTWRADHGTALLKDGAGAPVTDPEWPDEYVLDPSTPEQRTIILDVLGPVVTDCARKGFNAVEIDNLDTFTRFPSIDRAGALELATSYVSLAHEHGLAIGQKNAAEHTAELRALGFDFAVTEECAAFDECASYTQAYGRHVLQIEYVDNLPRPFGELCADADRAPLTILRDRELAPRGSDGYAYEQCTQ